MNKLFQTISEVLGEGCTLTLTIAKKEENLIVSVLPGNSLVKDAAKESISPLNVKGTAEELDEGFADAIKAPIKRVSGMFVDMVSFEKAEEEAKAKSQMVAKQKQELETKKNNFKSYIALAKTNLEQNKFKDATTCLVSAKLFSYNDTCQETINKVSAEINKCSGKENIFGAAEDKSDGKNVKIKTSSADVKSKSAEECKDDEENED